MSIEGLRDFVERVERTIAGGPIVSAVTPREIRDHLARYDFAQPMPLDDVMADVASMMGQWHVQVTHPRYFGLFNPSVTFPSIVGDVLAAAYNPQLATWRTSPAANEIERHTLAWLAGKFGLPASTAATFTSGGAEANHSAVIAALTRAFPEYGERGLGGLRARPTVYLTRNAHDSFTKIAHMTGLGRQALRAVATDEDGRLDVADLARTVERDRQHGLSPLLAIATAGMTATGAIDPLDDIARFCGTEKLWLHVDAAWGGAAVLSPQLRGHLRGIEHADSITCDAHKWFSVPMGAGMFFCRHAGVVREAFRTHTGYMPHATAGAPDDPYTTTMQWSRRFIGLKLFVALASCGERGYVDQIERQARMGDVLRASLAQAGWRIVNRTPLPLVCFTREGLAVSEFVAELHACQIAWMSEVGLAGGQRAIRACITSFRTTDDDVHHVVREMTRRANQKLEVQA